MVTGDMTPVEFIRKWKVHALTERAAAQEHFIDLCRMFEHPTPAEADPDGAIFTFEKGVSKTGGGDGWADVWKKGFFAWEYKKRRRNLDEALVQLTRYAAALEHPPLLVVCDTIRFQITRRVGFVSTNSIRGGANRRVLEPIAQGGAIFEAWSDEPWIVDGAAVRVSLVCFGEGDGGKQLDGAIVKTINADLTGHGFDITQAKRLAENEGVAFMGDIKVGAFDVPGELARAWLREPLNPNGRPNSDVLRPWVNGLDVTRRPRDMWIIDFGWEMSEREAAMYEAPFTYVLEHVKPERDKNRDAGFRQHWWRHGRPRPDMWAAIENLAAASPLPRAGEGGPAKPGRVRARAERQLPGPSSDPRSARATFSRKREKERASS